MTAFLELKNISFSYGKTLVLHDFSLTVENHESLILLGKSGSGKTTILNLILGLLEPQAGDILLNGGSLLDIPPEKRLFGYVPQGQILFPHLTVKENILFPLKAQGIVKTEQEKRLQEVTRLVNITELLTRKPREISGGQAQRVALARAVIAQPRLLLMDEPLSSIDAVDKEALALEIKRVQRETGTTLIYVTHDQIEARMIADRVALLVNGVLKQIGNIKELSKHPGSPEIAELLGLPNVIHESYRDIYKEAGLESFFSQGFIPIHALKALPANDKTCNKHDSHAIPATFLLSYIDPYGQVIGIATLKTHNLRIKFLIPPTSPSFTLGEPIFLCAT